MDHLWREREERDAAAIGDDHASWGFDGDRKCGGLLDLEFRIDLDDDFALCVDIEDPAVDRSLGEEPIAKLRQIARSPGCIEDPQLVLLEGWVVDRELGLLNSETLNLVNFCNPGIFPMK